MFHRLSAWHHGHDAFEREIFLAKNRRWGELWGAYYSQVHHILKTMTTRNAQLAGLSFLFSLYTRSRPLLAIHKPFSKEALTNRGIYLSYTIICWYIKHWRPCLLLLNEPLGCYYTFISKSLTYDSTLRGVSPTSKASSNAYKRVQKKRTHAGELKSRRVYENMLSKASYESFTEEHIYGLHVSYTSQAAHASVH